MLNERFGTFYQQIKIEVLLDAVVDLIYQPKYEILKLFAYLDSKCTWGYVVLCENCKPLVPSYVNINKPIQYPPALGKKQKCEFCQIEGILC